MSFDPTLDAPGREVKPPPSSGESPQRGYVGVVVFVVLMTLVLAAGVFLRRSLGIELSVEGLRLWVAGMGWKAPVIFVALVTFRQFLLLPSAVVLSAGGLCFGALTGTSLGTLGIALSALMKFFVARHLVRRWLHDRMRATLRAVDRYADGAGPLAVGLSTALPMGPMAPMHWAAGFSSVPLAAFCLAVGLGSPVRAFLYSFFGASLDDLGSPRSLIAGGLLLTLGLLPLAHPRLRQRILAGLKRPPTVA